MRSFSLICIIPIKSIIRIEKESEVVKNAGPYLLYMEISHVTHTPFIAFFFQYNVILIMRVK